MITGKCLRWSFGAGTVITLGGIIDGATWTQSLFGGVIVALIAIVALWRQRSHD